MKSLIRCAQCQIAALKPHVGFVGADELYCTCRYETVQKDDGCTFGAMGQPMTGVTRQDINIGEHAAVMGSYL